MARRWLLPAVTMVGILATVAALAVARHPRGVFWSRVDVQFLVPYSSSNPNVLKTSSSGLVATAGAVGRVVDPTGGKKRLASQDVTLASEGIEHGSTVTLPNAGGQWSNSFAEPSLQVEAVGTSSDEVSARMAQLIARIRTTLAAMQPADAVARRNMITLIDSPSGPPPIYFQPASRTRALAAICLLGAALTVVARTAVRRFLRAGTDGDPPQPRDDVHAEPVRVGTAPSGAA